MFYDKYVALCSQRGVTPSRAAMDSGISKSLVTKWKHDEDATPSPEVLKKLSRYFGVPISELLEEAEPLVNDDQELNEYLQALKTRPEMRMLFQLSKDASKKDVETAVRIIEALREK
ncbi:MAG: helix-turn-helix domain-containing protein [Faecousia sp.]